MAIRFFCQRCNQLLGIASRKAGTEIACPTCGLSQTVPNEEAAAAALAMGKSAGVQAVVQDASDIMVYDDQPAAIETPRRRAPETVPAASPSPASQAAPEPAPQAILPGAQAARPVPHGMILYRRQTLYVQAVLFVVVAAVGFGSGYFIGRGDATFEEQVRREQAERKPVLIEGKLTYLPAVDRRDGDEGAVAIVLPVLPEGEKPDKRIIIQGIRPQAAAPRARDAGLRAIEKLGGAYARAGGSGSFSVQVPQQGAYWVLLISRNTNRPGDSQIEELAADEMKTYFTSPADLIGRHKYRWTREDFSPGSKPTIEHDFGRDEQP